MQAKVAPEITEKVFKYYFAGASRIAMRENGTLTWLISDHLGSTSVTADASGNLVSSLRYTAFGDLRAAGGTTSTDYRYTGQRSEAEIGLYYYVARFYDPYLNHWTQPDTIVPDPYNPLDWNRYSYVRNNPINANDPSGHMVADARDDGGVTPAVLKKWLEQTYKWNAAGEDWNTTQLFFVLDAGIEIRHQISDIRGEDGIKWMNQYLGGTYFYKCLPGGLSMGPYSDTVLLAKNFEKLDWELGTTGMIMHEIAHVLDNRIGLSSPNAYLPRSFGADYSGVVPVPAVISGGGPADALISFLGGSPNTFRFSGGVKVAREHQYQEYTYGNNSSADYFAHVFSSSIVDYSNTPIVAALWMKAFLDLLP